MTLYYFIICLFFENDKRNFAIWSVLEVMTRFTLVSVFVCIRLLGKFFFILANTFILWLKSVKYCFQFRTFIAQVILYQQDDRKRII